MLSDTAADYIAGTLLMHLGGFLFVVVAFLAAIWYGAQWYERKAKAKAKAKARRAVKAWREQPASQRMSEAYANASFRRLTGISTETENPFGIRASCSYKQRFKCCFIRDCKCRKRPEPEEVGINIVRKTATPGISSTIELRELKAGEVEADIGLVPPPVKWDQTGADILQDISDAMDAAPPENPLRKFGNLVSKPMGNLPDEPDDFPGENDPSLLVGAICELVAEAGIYLPSTTLRDSQLIQACKETTERLNQLSIGYEKLRQAILRDTPHRRLRVMAEELLP